MAVQSSNGVEEGEAPQEHNRDGSGDTKSSAPHWPPYDLAHQKFMQVGVSNQTPIIRDHYRAHRLALWTHLIPQLHRFVVQVKVNFEFGHNYFIMKTSFDLSQGQPTLKFDTQVHLPRLYSTLRNIFREIW